MGADFVKVAETKDIQPSNMRAVDLEGEERICIVNVEGKYYAIGNVCTHPGGPLDEGTLEGYEVECPWRTGRPNKPPARQAVPVHEVKVEDNNILLRKHNG